MKKRDSSAPRQARSKLRRQRHTLSQSAKRVHLGDSRRRRRFRATSSVPDTVEVLQALVSLKNGDFSVRLPLEWTGLAGKVADTFNEVADLLESSSGELNRIRQVVGEEGRLTERMAPPGDVPGAWGKRVNAVNSLIERLVHPTNESARVIGAVARGDLSQSMALEMAGRPLKGEFLRTATTVNTMVQQLSSFASEVTRVAREVGTEGKLGGQADVKDLAGTWKDLTQNVNLMASNLTSQVRNIAAVTTAVARFPWNPPEASR